MKLERMFEACFRHLGEEAYFLPQGEAFQGQPPYPILMLLTRPDEMYRLGEARMVGQMIYGEIRINEVSFPRIGDSISLKGCMYKIIEEPLRDASGYVWKVTAMRMEEE